MPLWNLKNGLLEECVCEYFLIIHTITEFTFPSVHHCFFSLSLSTVWSHFPFSIRKPSVLQSTLFYQRNRHDWNMCVFFLGMFDRHKYRMVASHGSWNNLIVSELKCCQNNISFQTTYFESLMTQKSQ